MIATEGGTAAVRSWTRRQDEKARRLAKVKRIAEGNIIATDRIVDALEVLIAPGDRVVLEGNNQKQASFLSKALCQVDPAKINRLHMIMSSISRAEHLDIFEKGIAEKIDFSYAGPQSLRVSQMLEDGILTIGDIHTYLELFGRLFIDLIPNVALVAADKADAAGNLYTGPNTEETPTIVEATAFKNGIVIAQVNELVDELPRVDLPGSWIDFIVVADQPYQLEALFTRDPRYITDLQILMAMMTIRGVYERHQVQSLNHGIGYNTGAIELLLPTYGEQLGLKGKICKYWALNPHPTLIPAIENGWVESIHCFGGEVGMEKYVAARPDVFFTGRDGSLRSNRALSQVAGQYAVDLFVGSTLQMDQDGHSSTVTCGRLSGFGGAPNMGHDPRGRRHTSAAWLDMAQKDAPVVRGRKLVVQMVETFQTGNAPVFVESLDAISVGRDSNLRATPVMIYGDDVTHVVTEEGIAYLYKAQSLEERRQAIASIAGVTPVGLGHDPSATEKLRQNGLVALPEDLGIRRTEAKRSLLAAKSVGDLVQWEGYMIHRLNFAVGRQGEQASGLNEGQYLDWLADRAVTALIEEAELTPKPGLVDRASTGSHSDMDITVMLKSAYALRTAFRDMASAAYRQKPSQKLREELARIGRRGEEDMLRVTGGVNTHKGAIWALGLLISGTAMLAHGAAAEKIAKTAGLLARFDDRWTPSIETNGARVQKRFGTAGAREEARRGFPHVTQIALPTLWQARKKGVPETAARLDALVMLIGHLDDTCILHRGGEEALFAAKMAARAVIEAGGTSTENGLHLLRRLDEVLLAHGASPGGSADLLAAAIFLDSVRIETSVEVLADGNHEFSV